MEVMVMTLIGAAWFLSVVIALFLRHKSRKSFERKCELLSRRRSHYVKRCMGLAAQDPDRIALAVMQWGVSLLAADHTASQDWFWEDSRRLVHRYEKNFQEAVDVWLESKTGITDNIKHTLKDYRCAL